MFALSIAVLALSLLFASFGMLGVAGPGAIVASVVLFMVAIVAMITYWRRRPAEQLR